MSTSLPDRNSSAEKHFSQHCDYPMGSDDHSDGASRRIKTATSDTISPATYEKVYLSPETAVKGDLRKTFANPTPLALLGFLLSLSPLACDLMGWRGAGGHGIASIGAYYFMGGLLMFLGGVLEFILGNTFSFVVFCSFGGFWFSLGATLQPSFNAYGYYSPDKNNPSAGLDNPTFLASLGFYMLFMAILSFIYMICALRTNIVFVMIFFGLFSTFAFLTATYWQIADGAAAAGARLQIASGVFSLLAVLPGWYIFIAQMLESLDFPFSLPVGDLSTLIKSASERKHARERQHAA
ncbi:MAG: hypothetical protein M1825_001402 [Sarcosagium campestre]|nr:MAG: hypothetical protein M1825_001402 [Sarcosagium campestre]